MLNKITSIPVPIRKAALAGALASLLLISVIRFFTLETGTHYHANFAVFINGEREAFESNLYYEEVQSCSADTGGPRSRVHMHQPDNNVVHVHDEGATWGNLFENLGWTLNNRFFASGTEIYDRTDENNLIFVLNGSRTQDIANKVIGDEDRLLVSYGDSDTAINAEYAQVEASAPLFNTQPDPGSCSGSDTDSFMDRVLSAVLGA